MKKETPCPECGYPMDTEVIRKGGAYKAKIERNTCPCCGHIERAESNHERFQRVGFEKQAKFKAKLKK